MTLDPGHCVRCHALVFRTATHGRTGKEEITYPMSDSVYARIRVQPGSSTPGVAYCMTCAPQIGTPGPDGRVIVGLDLAEVRYRERYTDRWGAHFRAWLQDHMELPDHERDALFAQWEKDRGLSG